MSGKCGRKGGFVIMSDSDDSGSFVDHLRTTGSNNNNNNNNQSSQSECRSKRDTTAARNSTNDSILSESKSYLERLKQVNYVLLDFSGKIGNL